MLVSLMGILANNKHNEYPQRIFEIGKIFKGLNEINYLCYLSSHAEANFTEAKQVLSALMNALNLNVKLIEKEDKRFISGRCASVLVENSNIGIIGEIHPEFLEKFELEMPVCSFEIDVDKIFIILNKR